MAYPYIWTLATNGSRQVTPLLDSFKMVPLFSGQNTDISNDPYFIQNNTPFTLLLGAADVWGAAEITVEVSPDGVSLWTPLTDSLGNALVFNSSTGNKIVDIIKLKNVWIRGTITGSNGATSNVCLLIS